MLAGKGQSWDGKQGRALSSEVSCMLPHCCAPRRTLLLLDREGGSGNSGLAIKQLTAQLKLWIPVAPLGGLGGVLREG